MAEREGFEPTSDVLTRPFYQSAWCRPRRVLKLPLDVVGVEGWIRTSISGLPPLCYPVRDPLQGFPVPCTLARPHTTSTKSPGLGRYP